MSLVCVFCSYLVHLAVESSKETLCSAFRMVTSWLGGIPVASLTSVFYFLPTYLILLQ